MKLSTAARKAFQEAGRQGGLTRAKNNSKAKLRQIARKAAQTRWARKKQAA